MNSERVILRETRLSICEKCEELYVADDGATGICTSCRKSQSLFADLFDATRKNAAVPGIDISDRAV